MLQIPVSLIGVEAERDELPCFVEFHRKSHCELHFFPGRPLHPGTDLILKVPAVALEREA